MRKLFTTLLLSCLLFLSALAESTTEVFTPVPGMTIGDDFVVFEAEATTSPLGLWEIIVPGDVRYKGYATHKPINETHLEFTGNDKNGGTATSPLEYTFVCPKTATYRLGARLFQRLEGEPDDKCNDVYIKMAGDFVTGNSIATTDLQHNQKFFGRGVDSWGALYSLEIHSTGVKAPALYKLKEGETYTLTVSGRAQRTNIDYWLLYDTSLPITLAGHQDLMGVNDEKYRPIIYKCQTFNAVDMIYTGIAGFTDAATDKKEGMDILQIADRDAWAAAQMVFQGQSGEAYFTLNTLQEIDGEPLYRVKINGELVGEVQNDRINGTTIPDYTVQEHKINTQPVALSNGDVIQVEFQNATNGLIPEGDQGLTATARGRWLSLDICTSGSFAEYYFDMVSDSIALQVDDTASLELDQLLPYNIDQTVTWTSLNPTIASVDTDGKVKSLKNGLATIKAEVNGGEYTATCRVMTYTTLPYSGTPVSLPGVIECEDYDNGGEGKAYHDLLPYNAGNVYRQSEKVDLEACNDGGYNLRSTQAGEWLVYTVYVAESGSYDFHASVACTQDDLKFDIEIDDVSLLKDVTAVNTGDLKNFESVVKQGVSLTQGRHVIKLSFASDGINMSWMGFFSPGTVFKPLSISVAPTRYRLDADETKEMFATVLPVVAPDKSVVWSSTYDSIAVVDANGVVKGIGQGKTYIKATTVDGGLSDSTQVQVFGYSALDEEKADFALYPNPSHSGIFHLQIPSQWEVYNSFGIKVAQGQTTIIDISDLARGYYILKTQDGTKSILYQ